MPKPPEPLPDDEAQSARFIEAAKSVEVEDDGEALERAMKTLAPEKRAKMSDQSR